MVDLHEQDDQTAEGEDDHGDGDEPAHGGPVAFPGFGCLEAVAAAGEDEWVRAEIAGVLGEPLLDRFVEGSRIHAVRRIEEMEAAAELLRELGIEPRVAEAAAGVLRRLAGS